MIFEFALFAVTTTTPFLWWWFSGVIGNCLSACHWDYVSWCKNPYLHNHIPIIYGPIKLQNAQMNAHQKTKGLIHDNPIIFYIFYFRFSSYLFLCVYTHRGSEFCLLRRHIWSFSTIRSDNLKLLKATWAEVDSYRSKRWYSARTKCLKRR